MQDKLLDGEERFPKSMIDKVALPQSKQNLLKVHIYGKLQQHKLNKTKATYAANVAVTDFCTDQQMN